MRRIQLAAGLFVTLTALGVDSGLVPSPAVAGAAKARQAMGIDASINAGELMASLERRLIEARSLTIQWEVSSGGTVLAEMKGMLEIRNPNQVRLRGSGDFKGKSSSPNLSSDGKTMQGGSGTKRFKKKTPRGLSEGIVVGLIRAGLSHHLEQLSKGSLPDHLDGSMREWAKVEEASAGRAEADGDRRIQPITFTISMNEKEVGEATLWLDGKSGLPVKRSQIIHSPEGDMKVVERYTQFVADWGSP